MRKLFYTIVMLGLVLAACSGDGSNTTSAKQDDESEVTEKNPMKWNLSVAYGNLVDRRDGKSYRTVMIGSQTWMAENLRLEAGDSFCFDDKFEYCDTYGKLYPWYVAVGRPDCAEKDSCDLAPVMRGVCPEGWHLPSLAEWDTLFAFVGTDIVHKLKSQSEEWCDFDDACPKGGLDTYGFGTRAGGYKSWDANYVDNRDAGYFWASSQADRCGMKVIIGDGFDVGDYECGDDQGAASVRCVMDSEGFMPDSMEPSFDYKDNARRKSVEFEMGTMTDSRDGHVYKTVTIVGFTWMAENLNYRYTQKTAELDSSSFCPFNETDSCDVYGRLYLWSAAMDSVAMFSEMGKGCGYDVYCSEKIYLSSVVRGVCPEGWHLPDRYEWEYLAREIGGVSVAGTLLKSNKGWDGRGNGTDEYGFSILPVSTYQYSFQANKYYTGFWSFREDMYAGLAFENEMAEIAYFDAYSTRLSMSSGLKNSANPVRCVKNLE